MTDKPTATQREGNVDAVRLLTWQKQRPYGVQPLDAEMLGYLRSMLDSHDAPNVIIDDQAVPVFRLYEVLDRIAELERENARLRRVEQAARECVRVADQWHGVSESGYLVNLEQHLAERQSAYDALKAVLADGSGE